MDILQSQKKAGFVRRLPLTQIYGVIFIALLSIPVSGQHYISAGFGVNLHFFNSPALDQFSDSYNLLNVNGLTQILEGPNRGAFGLRREIGYRRLRGKYGAGIRVGVQQNIIRDAAEFAGVGERRQIKYQLDFWFADLEFSRYFGNCFAGIVLSGQTNRRFQIEASYKGPGNVQISKPLNGTYHSPKTNAVDIGLTAGLLREPVIFSLRVSYPLYTGGGSDVLVSDSTAKRELNSERFPADYRAYSLQQDYAGIPADISGFQIMISTEFGFGF